MFTTRKLALTVVPSLLAILVTTTAGARPFHGPRGGGNGGPGPGAFGHHDGDHGDQGHHGLSPCRQDCQSTGVTCSQQARTDAHQCAETNCAAEIQAVTDACTTDPQSTDCQTARTAKHTCVKPCIDAEVTALSACRTDKQVCAVTCPSPTPHPGTPDPQCVSDCRTAARTCQSAATETAQTCLAGCGDLLTAAKQACSQDYTSTDCHTARQQAVVCIEPCNLALDTAIRGCTQTGRSCTVACVPAATPTP